MFADFYFFTLVYQVIMTFNLNLIQKWLSLEGDLVYQLHAPISLTITIILFLLLTVT